MTISQNLCVFLALGMFACGCRHAEPEDSGDPFDPIAEAAAVAQDRAKARAEKLAEKRRKLVRKVLDGAVLARTADVGILYYPYSLAFRRSVSTPQPDYLGWTDARMDRDLERFGRLALSRIYVNVDGKQVLRKKALRERYATFLAKAEELDEPVVIAFVVDGAKFEYKDFELFLTWCAGLNLNGASGYWKVYGKPVVTVLNAPHLKLVSHPALRIYFTAWDQPVSAESDALKFAKSNLDRSEVVVRAGHCLAGEFGAETKWLLRRKDGRTVVRALAAAEALEPKTIIIDSWNDYESGSFVEPNGLDGSLLFEVLTGLLNAPNAADSDAK